MKTRPTFSPAFKVEIAKLMVEQYDRIAQACAASGAGPSAVRRWKLQYQDFRFPSFPRRRDSSKPLKSLDTRFRGYDEFTG